MMTQSLKDTQQRTRRRIGGERARMSDVAERANVSPMTVSRALRDPQLVSAETRKRIQAAIDEVGYVPNRLAGSLASNRTNVVGLIVPSIKNSLFADTIQATAGVLAGSGYHLLIAESGHEVEEEERLIGALVEQRVCGIVLHNTSHTKRTRKLVRTSAASNPS